jgi:predicted Zn-dependent protease
MDLNIVPIEYDKRGLEEIVRIIHNAFPDFFDGVHVEENISRSAYKKILQNPNGGLSYILNSNLLKLLNEFEGPVLGITSCIVLKNREQNKFELVYGGAIKKESCFVSMYCPELSVHEGYSRRAGIVCVHELGHVFGLDHHENCKEIPAKDSLCPMEIGHRTFRDKKEISKAHYFDARKTKFCGECYEKLQNLPQPFNQFF